VGTTGSIVSSSGGDGFAGAEWCRGRARGAPAGARCGSPGSCRHRVARGLEHAGRPRRREQQDGGEKGRWQHEHAEVADQAPHDALEQLADLAAVGLAEPQRAGEQQADAAGAERAHRGQDGPQDEDRADGGQRRRHGVGHVAEQPLQALDRTGPGLAAVAVAVDDEAEEHRQGDQAEAGEVEVALLDLQPGALLLAALGPGVRGRHALGPVGLALGGGLAAAGGRSGGGHGSPAHLRRGGASPCRSVRRVGDVDVGRTFSYSSAAATAPRTGAMR
jgi:hypothetical protein